MLNQDQVDELHRLCIQERLHYQKTENFWKENIQPLIEQCKTEEELKTLHQEFCKIYFPLDTPSRMHLNFVFAMDRLRNKNGNL